MKPNKQRLLSISLFCPKKNWKSLMTRGILEFLKTEIAKQHLLNFNIELSYTAGENIRLILAVRQHSADIVSKEVDSYFNGFFRSVMRPITSKKKNRFDLNTGFLLFPTNSVQYGIFSTESLKRKLFLTVKKKMILREIISVLILEHFKTNPPSNLEKITFSFSFFSLVINSMNTTGSPNILRQVAIHFFEHRLSQAEHPANLELAQEAYVENSEYLMKLFQKNKVSQISSRIKKPAFEINFRLLDIVGNQKRRSESNVNSILSEIDAALGRQLSLSVNSQIFINTFIAETLKVVVVPDNC